MCRNLWRLLVCASLASISASAPAAPNCSDAFDDADIGARSASSPVESLPFLSLGTFNLKKLAAIEPARLKNVVNLILDEGLDIIAFEEIADFKAYRELFRAGLAQEYFGFFFTGQPRRRINSAVVFKKKLPIEVEPIELDPGRWAHPEKGGKLIPLFPRGLPILHVRGKRGNGERISLFTLLAVHLKSKSKHGKNFDPNIERRVQLARLAEIVASLRTRYGPNVILAGDFNADLSGIADPDGRDEFRPLWDAGFLNTLELGDTPVAENERYTHMYYSGDHRAPLLQQLDGVLVSAQLRHAVATSKVRRTLSSSESSDEVTYPAGWTLSDHFLLFTTFRLSKFLSSE